MADKYSLRVTAGPDYAEKDQKLVHVNTETPTDISTDKLSAALTIRIQNYRGEPSGSPKTCAYFGTEAHKSDLYSIAFSFTPKKDINGHDLVFGNDFDHPVRDKLPPGFSHAMKIAQWFIDPGLYGDAYADEPYLYGPFLSSINTFRIGAKDGGKASEQQSMRGEDKDKPVVVFEGADGDGVEDRKKQGVPDDAAARKKHFLKEQHLKDFTFEKGRSYQCDFFNPYLDFNDFALKLPGFSYIPGITIPIISYWDGQPLRYVLKDRSTNEVLFVIIFTLVPHQDEKKEETTEEEGEKKTEKKKKEESDDLD